MSECNFTIDQILSNSLTESDYKHIDTIKSDASFYLSIEDCNTAQNKLNSFIESALTEEEEISNLLSGYNSAQSYLTNITSNKLLAHAENFVNTSYNNLHDNYTGSNAAVMLLSKLNSVKLNIIRAKSAFSDLQEQISAEQNVLKTELQKLKDYRAKALTARSLINTRRSYLKRINKIK